MLDRLVPDIATAYDPAAVESHWYQFWQGRGYFSPRIDPDRQPFTIIMPPPNVTGELHLGHALTATIEDILVRWHRMLGDPTLWLPGRDHASIAAQVVLEQQLGRDGVTRHQLGREKFLERMWDWMDRYGRLITQPLGSLDLCESLPEGPGLSGRADHQLVPTLLDGPLGPGGGARGRPGEPLLRALPAGRPSP